MARPSKPWFRESRNAWYATIHGRMTPLGVKGKENRGEAEEAWHRLVAGGNPQKVGEVRTVADVVNAFLMDTEERVKKNTYRMYRLFLVPFLEAFGAVNLASLT